MRNLHHTCITCSTPPTTLTPHSGNRFTSSASASASLVVSPETTSSRRINLGLVARRGQSQGASERPRAIHGRKSWPDATSEESPESLLLPAPHRIGLRVCMKAPSITFSSTVKLGSGFTI